jgi:hypothetical protein
MRVAGLTIAVLVGVVVALGYGAPARADGELTVSSRAYACSPTQAGLRTGNWHVASAVGAAGTVTAVSVSGGSASGVAPGDSVGAGGSLTVGFSVGAGPSSVTLSLSVHWDDTGSGPLDASVQDTIALTPCQPKPGASLVQDCAGRVTVTLTNGSTTGHDAGGTALFTITGTGGYRQDGVAVPAGTTTTRVVPAANAQHVQVSANGVSIVDGSAPYPGCASAPAVRPTTPKPSASHSASDATSDPPSLAGAPVTSSVAVPSAYPLGGGADPQPRGNQPPLALLGGVIAAVGAVAGLIQWAIVARPRRAGTDPSDLSR